MSLKLSPGSYVNIPLEITTSWGLKPLESMVYGIIYGFSQNGQGEFWGSIDYLCEATNSNRSAIIRTLNNLSEKGLIQSRGTSPYRTNVYTVTVKSKQVNFDASGLTVTEKSVSNTGKIQDTCLGKSNPDSMKIQDNNILNNSVKEEDEEQNSYLQEVERKNKISSIIKHYNQICNTRYSYNSKNLNELLKKLLLKYSVEDINKVIEFKYNDLVAKPTRFKNGKMSVDYMVPGFIFEPNKFEEFYNKLFMIESSESTNNKNVIEEELDDECF